jgi:hypothetical protein
MVLKKKNLTHILENNNEPEETPQPQTPQHIQTQMQEPQPPASAPRQTASEADWGELLVKLLASAPEDVAQKLAACIDREVLLKVLQHREDPYIKVVLLLLKK